MRIDPLQITDAEEILGLEHPVYVQIRKAKHFAGKYIGLQDHPHSGCAPFPGGKVHHVILINPRGPDASNTLWHELTHALQCERDFDSDFHALAKKHTADSRAVGASSSIKSASVSKRYQNTPLEKEAIENAEKMHAKYPFEIK